MDREPAAGDRLGNRWNLVDRLGSGAFGTVWRARDAKTGAQVAVKTLHPHHAASEKVLGRFVQEAQIQTRLSHPALVPVLAWRDAPVPFLVMPLVEGVGLHERLSEHASAKDPVSLARLAWLFEQMTGAVATAHDEGVVHRDLKPRNVLVNPRGRGPDFVRILDFGVAKVLGGGQLAPTTVGRVMGSVLYLAPEQVMSGGAPPTPAVDQFSLASIFFECLTLRRAWARDDDGVPLSFDVPVGAEGDNKQMTILKRIVRQESPRLRAWRSDAGAEAERVLARALSKEPADRFSSVEVFGQALAGALTRASGDADDPEDTAWERLPPLDDYGST